MGGLIVKREILLSSLVFSLFFLFLPSVSAVPDGWGNEINLTGNNTASDIRMALDSDNNLHIVWNEYIGPGQTEVMYMKINENGTTLITPKVVTPDLAGASSSPDIAVDHNDTVHIVWSQSNILSSYTIYYEQQDKNGNTIINDKNVTSPEYQTGHNSPRLHADSNNSLQMLYTRGVYLGGTSIDYTKLDSNGNPIINGISVFSGAPVGYEFALDAQDNLHLAIGKAFGLFIYYIAYEKLNKNGVIIAGPHVVSEKTGFDPQIVLDSQTNNHLVWASGAGVTEYNDIMYTKLNSTGGTLIDDITLTGNTSLAQSYPSLTIDSNNRLHVAYSNSSYYRINYIQLNTDGQIVQDALPVAFNSSVEPFILSDRQNKIQLIWRDQRNASRLDIFYKKKVGAPLITKLIPIQVVEDVPLVKGKRTLVRAVVESSTSGGDTLHAKIWFNNSLIYDNASVSIPNPQTSVNLDVWVPDNEINIVGSNIPVKAEAVSTITGFSSPNKTKMVNVVETNNLNLFFAPITDFADFSYFLALNNYVNFLQDTYPVREGGILTNNNTHNPIDAPGSLIPALEDLQLMLISGNLLHRYYLSSNGPVNGVIGIVPGGYMSVAGKKMGFNGKLGVIFVQETKKSTLAHEMAHIFGLCEEYSKDEWLKQDDPFFLPPGQCPNGDQNNDSELDQSCKDNDGCVTKTLPQLYSDYNSISDETILKNFMGSANETPLRSWVSKETYDFLLNQFNISLELPRYKKGETVNTCQVVKFFIHKNGTLESFNSYSLKNCVTDGNINEGNITIEIIDNSATVISNVIVDPQYIITNQGGNSTEINMTFVISSLFIDGNATKIIVKNSTETLGQINKTPNNPQISLVDILKDETMSSLVNLSWNAFDIDNDTLEYAIILREKDGQNSTLRNDFDEKNLEINFSGFSESIYTLEILATDGFNTNSSNSDQFCIDHDLSVCGLKTLDVNLSKVIFEFIVSNSLNATLTNINWTMNMGDGNTINSTLPFNLTSSEDIFDYIEYQYSTNGNYSVSVTANALNQIDIQSINITI